jgi:acyl carrier protein
MDPMITKNEVLTFVRDIIEEVKDFDGVIEYETTLEALALDSLDYVQTQIEAKKRFGVDLTAELFITGQISTVGQLCDYIVEAQSGAALRPTQCGYSDVLGDCRELAVFRFLIDRGRPR